MANYTDVLSDFLLPGGGSLDANNGLALAALQSKRRSELEDRLAGDPTDQRTALLLKFLGRDEQTNPYSDTSVDARTLADQGAVDAANRSMLPAVQAAKGLAIKQAGEQKQAESFGTDLGKAQAADTDVAQHVAGEASHRKIQEVLAPNRAMLGEDVEGPFAGQSTESGGATAVDDLARKFAADPSYPIPPALKTVVAARAAQLGLNDKLTNQTRQMSESANDLLPIMDEVEGLAKDLGNEGLFTPGIGSVRNFLASHGAGSLLGMGPDVAQKIGRFNTVMGLLQSGIARAHAGARGAGNSDMAQRFERLLASQGDIPTFIGELQGARDLLSKYASHTNPNAMQAPSTAPADPLGIR